jgi:hypothetical protein
VKTATTVNMTQSVSLACNVSDILCNLDKIIVVLSAYR